MRGLTKNQKGTIGIIAVALMLVLGALAALLVGQSELPAQAHDDGTLHIHPTLTPTPTPTPTPLPALGLNGPLSLQTSMVYQKSRHRLIVTTVVNNPPPEGWRFEGAHVNVSIHYKGWSFETSGSTWQDDGRIALHSGVLTGHLPLPEYVDFKQLNESMIAYVHVETQWEDRREGYHSGTNHLSPRETMFVDLHDRRNWRE